MTWLRKTGLAILIVGAVTASVASGDSDRSTDGSSPVAGEPENAATGDVAVSRCALSGNQFGGPEATLTVTNRSSKPSNYFITVAFQSPDGTQQLDTGNATVQSLAPNQTTSVQASSFRQELRRQRFTCKVTEVTRFAS